MLTFSPVCWQCPRGGDLTTPYPSYVSSRASSDDLFELSHIHTGYICKVSHVDPPSSMCWQCPRGRDLTTPYRPCGPTTLRSSNFDSQGSKIPPKYRHSREHEYKVKTFFRAGSWTHRFCRSHGEFGQWPIAVITVVQPNGSAILSLKGVKHY